MQLKTTMVKCNECGDAYTTQEVNSDRVRFYLNGQAVRFHNVEQDQIDKQNFLCECCEGDRIDKEGYYEYQPD